MDATLKARAEALAGKMRFERDEFGDLHIRVLSSDGQWVEPNFKATRALTGLLMSCGVDVMERADSGGYDD